MKKICIAFNHLQISDGVAKAAIAIANYLSEQEQIEVTLRPIFTCNANTSKLVAPNVKIDSLFVFYVRGLAKILEILPKRILHDMIFGKEKYDIEIGFQYGIATEAVVSYGKADNLHLVWIHGYDDGLKLKNYYMRADKVVCVSKFSAAKLKNALHNQVCVEYCYNPIDEKRVQILGQEYCNIVKKDSDLLFVTVGRNSEEKGYVRLLDIVYRLKQEGYRFTLCLVGDGPLHSVLVKKAESLKIESFVVFTGEQDNPYKYMMQADVFICSSYSEGYSTVCTEASILGIPVLSTAVGGSYEIIETAQAGKVVGIDDEALYKGIKDILDCPGIVREWKQILNETKKKFASPERSKKLLELLGIKGSGAGADD